MELFLRQLSRNLRSHSPSLAKKNIIWVSVPAVSRAAPHLRSQLLAVRNNMADIYGG